jgi:hypothetical protein
VGISSRIEGTGPVSVGTGGSGGVTVVLVGPTPMVLGTHGAVRSTRVVLARGREESSSLAETPPSAMHATTPSIPSQAMPVRARCLIFLSRTIRSSGCHQVRQRDRLLGSENRSARPKSAGVRASV